MRHRIAFLLLAFAALVTASSCIENDIPYPVVECRIESLAADGLAGAPLIDYAARTVTLPLLETTDIRNVAITGAELTEGAEASAPIVGTHDLRTPLRVTLSLYQEYPWVIAADQTIERIFTVEGQVGPTEWNLTNREASVYVNFEDHSSVTVTGLKLGPAGITTMSYATEGDRVVVDASNLSQLRNFTTKRQIEVECHGRKETWLLGVFYTDVKVALRQADGWVRTAWLYGEGISGSTLGFRYREAGSEAWIEVDPARIESENGSFRTRVRGLQPETEYEAVAFADDEVSAVAKFVTQPELPLPNSGFEEWSKPGKILYPYLSEETAFWDTGNKGSATVNTTISESSSDTRPGSPGQVSAALTSTFASLAGIGKFAAGNIFIGTYAQTVGTNGKVNFGRPFSSRPVALRGWVKFANGKIDRIGDQPDGRTLTTDDYDEGSIFVTVGTWTAAEYGGTDESPVQVYTKKDERTLFDKNAKDVVGYGELVFTEPTDGWIPFEIPLDYRATNIVPTHLIIVCSASRWGDYFTGSTQNRMWVDDFELVWE